MSDSVFSNPVIQSVFLGHNVGAERQVRVRLFMLLALIDGYLAGELSDQEFLQDLKVLCEVLRGAVNG